MLRRLFAATLAATLVGPLSAWADDHEAVPVTAPPAAYVPVDPYSAAIAHRQAYRYYRREHRRQRHMRRHLAAAGVVVAPIPLPLPVPVVAAVPVALPLPVPVVAPVMVPVPMYVAAPAVVAVAPAPPPSPPAPAKAEEDHFRAILGVTGNRHPDGVALGAGMFLEGKRMGIHLGASGAAVRADDGRARLECLRLLEGHLTYAPLSGARGRVRLEGGVSALFVPNQTSFAPDIGLTGDLRLIGPFGIEGGARYAPFPHKRGDVWGGLFAGLGPLRIEGGWRWMSLNAEAFEGEVVAESFRGPYLGASLVF